MQSIKGLNAIVTSVLIILLSVAAVSLITPFIKNYSPSLSPAFSCLDLQSQNPLPLTISSACYNSLSQEVEVTLIRSSISDYIISSIDFSVFFADSSLNWQAGETCENCVILKPGEKATYYLDITEKDNPLSISVGINSCSLQQLPLENC